MTSTPTDRAEQKCVRCGRLAGDDVHIPCLKATATGEPCDRPDHADDHEFLAPSESQSVPVGEGAMCEFEDNTGVCARTRDSVFHHYADGEVAHMSNHPFTKTPSSARITRDEFIRVNGNYQPDEEGIYGKLGRALAGWKEAEATIDRLRDERSEGARCRHAWRVLIGGIRCDVCGEQIAAYDARSSSATKVDVDALVAEIAADISLYHDDGDYGTCAINYCAVCGKYWGNCKQDGHERTAKPCNCSVSRDIAIMTDKLRKALGEP
jgi:hypothetical protein